MGDDWFGHRNFLTMKPQGDRDEWIEWDYILVRLLQTIEDWTNEHGLLVYEIDDPMERTFVDAVKKIDKFEAAKHHRTSGKKYKPTPGEYFIPEIKKRSKEWPTMREYVEHQLREQAEKKKEKQQDENDSKVE